MLEEERVFQTRAHQALALLTKMRPVWEPLYPKLTRDFLELQSALDGLGRAVPAPSDALPRARGAAIEAALPLLGGLQALWLDGHLPGLGSLATTTRPQLEGREHPQLLDTLHELYFRTLPLMDELATELVTDALRDAFGTAMKAYAHAVPKDNPAPDPEQGHRARHLHAAQNALMHLDARIPLLARAEPELVAAYQRLHEPDLCPDPAPRRAGRPARVPQPR